MAGLRSERNGGSTTTRHSGRALTAESLAACWPEVRRALLVELHAAGLDRELPDVLQDVALRALAERAPDEVGPLLDWARPVALELAAGLARDAAQRLDLATLVDVPAADDVPYAASKRLALDAVLRGIAQMPEVDRAAVLAGLDYGTQATLAEARTVAVRRYRARQVLARIAKSFGLVIVWLASRRTWARLTGPMTATATAAVVMAVLGTGLPPERPLPMQPPPQVRLPQTERAVSVRRPAPAPPTAMRPVPNVGAIRTVTFPNARPPAPRPTPAITRTVIEGPAGTRVEHREEPQRADDRLACVWGPIVETVCTPPTP